ncbi:hypothetical protein TELCIR_16357 [Teladorsagia circumcincta]|uniref:Uncharacterized protein n=1 Tax=Teladorsagia circumcincta TaxID=45464 RepID=A0A2G9TVQ0_TELCI|nr:hypothetical protein TELCIR_16357 [Teladorsagia circumcincta]
MVLTRSNVAVKWDDDYVASLVHNGCFHLVTADGSLYAQDAPGEQESKTLPLLESELRIAQQLLANGGSLIVKAEVGIYRDHVFREFHKRALTSYIANPLRESHLNQEVIERPWMEMFGQNYVENLRQICDERSAVQFLKNFHQSDVMTEHETIGNVEVEFAENELEFLEWPLQALLDVKVIVAAPPIVQTLHSLFAPPGLLRSLLMWRPKNYSEDIPTSLESYLSVLSSAVLSEMGEQFL